MHKRFLLLILTLFFAIPVFAQLEVKEVLFNEENNIYPLPEEIKNEVVTRRRWPEEDRKTLLGFLENYQAAFINKDLGFINMVFKDKYCSDNNCAQEFIEKYEKNYKRRGKISFILSEADFNKSNGEKRYYFLKFKQKYIIKSISDEIYVSIFFDFNDDKKEIFIAEMNPDEEKLIDYHNVRFY